MTSKVIKEKLKAWQKEINDIKEKIDKLNDEKTKVNADIQAALKEKNTDKVISAQQAVTRLDEQIEALKLIEEGIKKTHPVDHETFLKEYGVFLEQKRDSLDKQHEAILVKLSELEDFYVSYENTYRMYITLLREWQELAGEIGLHLPLALNNNIQTHRGLRNNLYRLIRISKGGTI